MENQNSQNVTALKIKDDAPISYDVLNLDLVGNMEGAMEVLTKIVASKKIKKITTPEVALSYYLKTKELGLPFISSVDHMFNVSGTTSIDVHLMRALVLRAGTVYWEEIHNNVPLYQYTDETGFIVATGFNDDCLPHGFEVVKGNTKDELVADWERILSISKTPLEKKVDYLQITSETAPGANDGIFRMNTGTRYKFTRIIRLIDGTHKTITEYGEFSLREAIEAGLHLKQGGTVVDTKCPWLVYTRNMNEHRAWTFGCRKIADDITFGLLERTEQLDMEGTSYTIVDGDAEVVK